ncbi:serine hydrolase domain-containing protein [Planctomycetota bacterium]
MYKELILLIIFLVLLLGCCDKPESQNKLSLSSENNLPFAKSLQNALDLAAKIGNGKGISASIIIPNKGSWAGASGISHENTPVSPDMLFNIASVGKNFLATLVLKLCEEGVLRLDDPLHKWLPDYPNIDNRITVRQLLNHTSGIFDFVEHPTSPYRIPFNSIEFEKPLSHSMILKEMISEPYFQPGKGWHYSTTNSILLHIIVEKATQSSVTQEVQERFIEPLGLSHTVILDEKTTSIPSNFKVAHPWYDVDGNGTSEDIAAKPKTWSATLSPLMIFSSAEDLSKWSQALYSGKVISEGSLVQMLTFHRPTPGEPYTGYGLGTIEMKYGGIEMWGHLGWQYGYLTAMLYDPEHSASISLLINEINVLFGNCALLAIWLVLQFYLSTFLFIMVIISIISFVIMFLLWPLQLTISLFRFRKSMKLIQKNKDRKKALVMKFTAFISAIFVLTSVILYFLYTMNAETPLSWAEGSLLVKIVLLLSYLSASLSVLMIVWTVSAWKRPCWSLFGRFHFTVVTIALLVMIRFLITWNILF